MTLETQVEFLKTDQDMIMWAYDYDFGNSGGILKQYDQDMITWAYDYDFGNSGGIFKQYERTWSCEHMTMSMTLETQVEFSKTGLAGHERRDIIIVTRNFSLAAIGWWVQ